MNASSALREFTAHLDRVAEGRLKGAETAIRCAELLGELVMAPGFLSRQQREPDPSRYATHLVHVHPAGLYSIASLVWLPGQATGIHAHRCWCVVGVVEGCEREETFEQQFSSQSLWLNQAEVRTAVPGVATWLVPDGSDIHRVSNAGDELAISVHVYGADLTKVASSISAQFGSDLIRGEQAIDERGAAASVS